MVTGPETKKQVQTKEIKEKKKPKVKVTEDKRKARIINTNPNIKGPGVKGKGNVVTSYSKRELLELVRRKIKVVEESSISGSGLLIFKDEIKSDDIGIGRSGEFFFPQHLSKLE